MSEERPRPTSVDIGGGEREVWYDARNGTLTKTQRAGVWDTAPLKYLKNLANLAEFNPELGIQIIAVHPSLDGAAMITHVENHVYGRRAKSYAEVKAALIEAGFQTTGQGEWISPDKRFFLRDVNQNNVIIDSQGKPHIVDAMVEELEQPLD